MELLSFNIHAMAKGENRLLELEHNVVLERQSHSLWTVYVDPGPEPPVNDWQARNEWRAIKLYRVIVERYRKSSRWWHVRPFGVDQALMSFSDADGALRSAVDELLVLDARRRLGAGPQAR